MENLKPLLFELGHTCIEGLLLNYINKDSLMNVVDLPIWCHMFKELKYLSLDFNQLIFSVSANFRNFTFCQGALPPKLEYLSVAWNQLSNSVKMEVGNSFIKQFHQHKHIRFINFSFQMANIPWSDKERKICTMCNKQHAIFVHSKPYEFIKDDILDSEILYQPSDEQLELSVSTTIIPMSLEYIFLDGLLTFTDSNFPVFKKIFEYNLVNSNVRVISSTNNIVPNINFYMKGTEKLEYINLAHSHIQQIDSKFFQWMPGLKTAILKDNNLVAIQDILRNQGHLQTLDMSFNRIEHISPSAFVGLGELRQLHLNDNQLETLNVNLTNAMSLEYIDLSNNEFQFLNRQQLKQMEDANTRHELVVNLENNPFLCSCDQKENVTYFVDWVLNTNVSLLNHEAYSCIFKGKSTHLVHLKINEILNYCNTPVLVMVQDYAKFIFITAAIISLTCICFIAGYKYRWRIRFKWYVIKANFKQCFKCNKEEELHPANEEKRNVFVSYGRDEYKQAIKMCKTLEEKYGFTTYFKDRDFMVGDYIGDNIISAIEQTKHTIVILTDAFLDSVWCEFVFHMTIAMRGAQPIVVVLADKPIYNCWLQENVQNFNAVY